MTQAQSNSSRTRRLFADLGVRLYALLLLLLVLWAAWAALAYLFRSVFAPNVTPARFVNRPLNLPVEVLEQGGPAIAEGHTAPLDHYHGVGELAWGAARTGCSTSGCHAPLPHARDKATRAFTNLHVTFLDCSMCHDASLSLPIEAAWYNATTGDRLDHAPPLLAIAALFESLESTELTAETDTTLRRLLAEAVTSRPNDPNLARRLTELETTQRNSPAYRLAVGHLRRDVPNLARGEYGALLASTAARQRQQQQSAERQRWTREYLADKSSNARRRELHDQIHANVVARPNACLECHSEPVARMNYAAAAYPPQRTAQLQGLPIARLVQRIREGTPFYLPDLLEPGDEN